MSQILPQYIELKQVLASLHQHLIAPNIDVVFWQEQLSAAQLLFESHLHLEELSLNSIPRWQSIHTEMHRLFKLLAMDMMFLAASRQSATRQSRQQAMGDRLQTLIGYCDALIESSAETEH